MTEEALLLGALEKQTPAERQAYLVQACGADGDLRRRVEERLRLHGQAGSFLQQTPREQGTTALRTGQQEDAAEAGEGPGTILGRYTLERPLGEGGMGTVYLAEQREPVRRRVALKLIKHGMDSAQALARFEAERQALAGMDHPHIAKVYDADATADGRPYFVMELVLQR